MVRTAAVAGIAIVGALALGGVGSAATATARTTGGYQFASNEANGNWQMSDSPISDSAGTESLRANGVTLTASGNNAKTYGSAAVVIPLGKLSKPGRGHPARRRERLASQSPCSHARISACS
jgi:hypothetical protein